MKKSFWRTLVLSLAIMAVAIVCWRVKPAEAAHTHSWYVQRVDREATCTSTGTRTMRCSCGAYKTETIPKKAHVGVRWVVVKSPGCTTGGHREWVCSCGHSLRGEDIPSLGGHNWTLVSTTPSTCTTQGTKSYRCSRSGCSATRSESLGYASHVGVRWVTTIQPGCTTGGKEELLCSCGRVMNGHDIPSLGGHNWVETGYTASTCQTHGTRSYRCSRCGTTTSESLPLAAHVGCRWVTVVQPTCYSGGKEEWQCSCGHALNGRDIPTTAHKWVVDHTEPGNCIAWGKTYYRCQNSGCTQTKSEANIAPTGHNYAWMTTVSPTASANGTESLICLYCDTVEQSRSLYLISYVGNGGKNIPANQIKTQGVNITLSSTTPTREGYIFKGWGTSTGSDVLYQPGDVYTANARVKLSAVWEPKQFTVKYNLKGGKESGNAAFAEKTYVYGTTVKVASVAPTKTGYDFKGWDTSSAATTVRYNPGDDYTKYTNATLYAVWVAKEYTVTFIYPQEFWPLDGSVNSSVSYVTVADETYCSQKKTVKYGTTITMPASELCIPGKEVLIWTKGQNFPSFSTCWVEGDSYVVSDNQTFYAMGRRDDGKKASHDFAGFTRISGLDKINFISISRKDDQGFYRMLPNSYGANQGDYCADQELLWDMYYALYGDTAIRKMELNLANALYYDESLIRYLREKNATQYESLMTYLANSSYVINNVPTLNAVGIFAAINTYFNGPEMTDRIKAYYVELAGLPSKYLSGSCGIYAAINTYMYIASSKGEHSFTWNDEEVKAAVTKYLELSDGITDIVERLASGGDGPVSLKKFLNNQLSDYNCKTNWREIFGATYSNIKSMLDNNIPVIIAFYRHDKSGLRFYKANSNSTILEQVDSVESHYFIVTGIYENPNKPGLHYLEISTWGDRQYICFEEYQNGRGLSLFSTVLELSVK